MAANSFTGFINTEGKWVTVDSVTVGVAGSNFTGITEGKRYAIQVQNIADLKISDAEFTLNNKFGNIKATSDVWYIRTHTVGCILTILEEEDA